MMLLRVLYLAGLTDLTRDEVDQYETVARSDARIAESQRVKVWGLISLSLCALLAVSALGLFSMLRTLYTISDLEAKVSALDQAVISEPYYVTRGAGGSEETDPNQTLRRVHDRVQQIYRELNSLRLRSIDYSSLASQKERLAALNRELGKLSSETARAKKRLGAES